MWVRKRCEGYRINVFRLRAEIAQQKKKIKKHCAADLETRKGRILK